MQRRSNTKTKQQNLELLQKSGSKKRKNSQTNDRQATKQNDMGKKIKNNLMYSLIEVFQQSQSDPSIIVPWMKQFHQLESRIIGTSYMIVGPSQSGKYSAVKFALGEYHHDVKQILINCDICTTENQFSHQLLRQFTQKAPKCKWPSAEKDINKLITDENIDFQKLDPYIQKGNLKFVIVIRNGQHLVGFKKQTMLYNLFEWMRSSFIQERGGLVILTRNLMLIDRLEKRVRSRFQGNRLTIFRPTQAQIYIKIITKRIDAVINDRQVWLRQKLQETTMQDEKSVYNSEDQTNTRKRPKPKNRHNTPKASTQNVQHSLQDFLKLQQKYQYVKQVYGYSKVLTNYLEGDCLREMGFNEFFQDKINLFYQSKNKEEMRLYSDTSILTVQEQIECLNKIKKAIEKNTSILHYFRTKIMQNQIITIPFALRIFQHIFLTIEESIVKELPVNKLQRLILKLLQKNVQYEFPINIIESNSLQNLTKLQLLLLIFIYKMISNNIYPIKLTIIHTTFQSEIHTCIYQLSQNQSKNLPNKWIQRAIDRLYRNGIISYSPYNVWNCQISLLIEMQKIRKGLQNLAKHKSLPNAVEKELKDLHIIKKSDSSQKITLEN